jgi:hypothetical protein
MAAIGELIWFPIYFIVIWQNYKQKICGMPLIGICAIFVQCFIYATFGPYWRPDLFPHNPVQPETFYVIWVWRGWLVVQGIVLVQFFLYHGNAKSTLEVPIGQYGLGRVVATLLVLNLLGQWSFIAFYHDFNVNQSDPLAYLFLSFGFVLLARARPNLEGLSLTVAWMKFVGTALIFTTILARPVQSFGHFAMKGSEDPVQAQAKVCAMPPVVDGQACGLPTGSCEPLELICGTRPFAGVTQANAKAGDCVPEVKTILEAQTELATHGWLMTGPDTVYRSNVGEFDMIRRLDPRGPVWCPQTTSWNIITRRDGEWRFHFQFPVFMALAGMTFDAAYIVMLHRRRRLLNRP